jgi:hypothetical protein
MVHGGGGGAGVMVVGLQLLLLIPTISQDKNRNRCCSRSPPCGGRHWCEGLLVIGLLVRRGFVKLGRIGKEWSTRWYTYSRTP